MAASAGLRAFFSGALCAALLAGSAAAQEQRPLERAISEDFKAGKLEGLHAAIVILRGETLAEVYFDGSDERRGTPLGIVHHGPDTLHDVRSISKSVTALLYGVALAEGKVASPDAPLLAQFPEYADLAGDPLRDRITVGNALSMRMGTEWNEDLPYTDPRNSELAMERAPDADRYALDRPMVAAPGAEFSYNGGASALIGKLVANGTGKALDEYAREKLFEPLGITRWEWVPRRDGVPAAASGLRLTARDLAKIGQMVLDGGMYDGRRIVPREWLDQSFSPRPSFPGIRYGYFWWLADSQDPRAWVSDLGHPLPGPPAWPGWVAGIGNGGQRLSIQAQDELIVVVLAGNYNKPGDWLMPVRIIEVHVAPELRRRLAR